MKIKKIERVVRKQNLSHTLIGVQIGTIFFKLDNLLVATRILNVIYFQGGIHVLKIDFLGFYYQMHPSLAN